MATAETPDQAENGAPGTAPGGGNSSGGGGGGAVDPAARRAATKAAILAGAAKAATTAPAPAPEASAPAAVSASDTTATAAEAGAGGLSPAAGAGSGDDTDSPGMVAVRKAEQRARAQLAQERAEMRADLDRERAIYQRKIDELSAFKAKIDGGKKDRIGLLKALGYTEEEFEGFAFDVYANSPKGKQDPRFKDRAAQLQGTHEQVSAMDKLQAEIAELKQGISAKEQAQAQQARAEHYMAGVTAAVTDATPLAKAALAKNPNKTTAQMFGIALELYQASGDSEAGRVDPKPAEVLAEYDRRRALELEELGIDPKAVGAKPAPAAAAGRTVAAATGAAAAAQPAQPPQPAVPPARRSRAERLEGIRRNRESLNR